MPAHARADHNTGWVLKAAALATLAFFGAELACGYYARSLALLSDAWHNFSDALALFVTWFAVHAQARAPSRHRTYGYHRAGVLAAFVAALLVLGPAGWLFYRGAQRLLAPGQPDFRIMLALGVAGVVLNAGVSVALRRAARGEKCPPRVFLHMAGDALAGLGILLAALLIRIWGLRAADPLLGLLIAGLVVWTVWDVMVESLDILLEGLPPGLELEQVETAIRSVPRVQDVHDLHIWRLGVGADALTCHVRIPPLPFPDGEAILSQVNALLERRFRIRHATIQLECQECEAVNGCHLPGPR